MEDEQIQAAIQRAQRLAQEAEQPFRAIAFEAVLTRLLGQVDAVSKATAIASGLQPGERVDVLTNLNEFLALMKPESHFDRVAGIAYHQLHSGDDVSITVADVLNGYAQARVSRPKNIHDVIRKSVQKGLLTDSASKKNGERAWVITPTGEAHVDSRLRPQE
ncbi:MAG: hypothetical protein ABR978_04270 [Dehalococcoidia bacterium]|jgi:hypothetical protein